MDIGYAVLRQLGKNAYSVFISDARFAEFELDAVITVNERSTVTLSHMRFTFADNTDIWVFNRLIDMNIEHAILHIYSIVSTIPNKTFDKIFNYYNEQNIVIASAEAAINEGYEYRNPEMLASLKDNNKSFKVIDTLFVGHTEEDVVGDINCALISKEELADMKISF